MTVAELIEKLKNYSPDTKVFVCSGGDGWLMFYDEASYIDVVENGEQMPENKDGLYIISV